MFSEIWRIHFRNDGKLTDFLSKSTTIFFYQVVGSTIYYYYCTTTDIVASLLYPCYHNTRGPSTWNAFVDSADVQNSFVSRHFPLDGPVRRSGPVAHSKPFGTTPRHDDRRSGATDGYVVLLRFGLEVPARLVARPRPTIDEPCRSATDPPPSPTHGGGRRVPNATAPVVQFGSSGAWPVVTVGDRLSRPVRTDGRPW